MAATFERYWEAPIANRWNANAATWLSLEFFRHGNYESSEGCYMSLEESGEVWEYCRDKGRSTNGRVPFLISKYRPVRA